MALKETTTDAELLTSSTDVSATDIPAIVVFINCVLYEDDPICTFCALLKDKLITSVGSIKLSSRVATDMVAVADPAGINTEPDVSSTSALLTPSIW